MPSREDETAEFGRRALLRAGGATLAAGAAASVAGCQSGLPPLSGPVRFGRIDGPEPAEADHLEWVPPESELPSADEENPERADGIHLMYTEPRRLAGSVFGPTNPPLALTTGTLDYFGVGYRNYDRAVALSVDVPAVVAESDIDPDAVASVLDDTGYESAGSARGYDLYDRSDIPRSVAVGESAIVFAKGDRDEPALPRRMVETVLATGTGRRETHRVADPQFGTLTDRVGRRPFTWYGLPPFGNSGEQSVAARRLETSAMSWDFDEDAVYFVYDLVYPEGETVPERSVKGALESQRRATESSFVDVETDGRFARIEMRYSRRSPELDLADQSTEPLPQITWGVDHDREGQVLTLRHEVGTTVDTPQLRLRGDLVADRDGSFDGDTFGPGDSVTIDLSGRGDASTVQVVYESPDGDSSTTLLTYDLDEGENGTGGATTTGGSEER